MRYLVPLLFLVGCQTPREVITLNGTRYSDWGHLAGNNTVVIKPDGTVVLHEKMNQPWQDFMQLIAAAIAAWEAGDVGTAVVNADRAKKLAATRAGVDRIRAANELEKLRLAIDLEKFNRLNPLPSSLP